MPAAASACTTRSAASSMVGGCSTAVLRTPSPSRAGIRSCSPWPISTSYGCSAETWIDASSVMLSPADDLGHDLRPR